MKSNRIKIAAFLLACLMGMTAVGCNNGKDSSSTTAKNNSIASNEESSKSENNSKSDKKEKSKGEEVAVDSTEFMRQELQFSWGANSSGNDTQDQTEAGSNNSPSNNNAGTVTSYAPVTDTKGKPVTQANGQTVTQVVNVPVNVSNGNSNGSNGGSASTGSNSGSTGNSNPSGGNNNSSTTTVNGGNSGSAGTTVNNNDSYVEKMDTFQAYWLDMGLYEDFVFNGEFIVVTFKVKENTPDGNYKVHMVDPDFVNWDADQLTINTIDGAVTVGNATTQSYGTVENGAFTLQAESVKANPGDTVDVVFNLTDNPGLVGFIFKFQYDCNALEIVNAKVGADAEEYIDRLGG